MTQLTYNIIRRVVDIKLKNSKKESYQVMELLSEELVRKVASMFSERIYVYVSRTLLYIYDEPVVNPEYITVLEGSIEDLQTMMKEVINNFAVPSQKEAA